MHRFQGRAGVAAAATVVVVLGVIGLAVWKGGGSDVVVTDGTGSAHDPTAPAEASTSSSAAREGDNSGSLAEACGVEDIDGDEIFDGCDNDVEDGPTADPDGDGIVNVDDNCQLVPNPDQNDGDRDGVGNVCDADGPEGDRDADGVANRYDNCEEASNADQRDGDGDGIGDACDSDLDDGPDADPDGDGISNTFDNCDATENPDQADADGDGVGDLCDSDRVPPPPADDSPAGTGGDDQAGGSNTGSDDEVGGSPPGGDHPISGQPCVLFLHGAGTTRGSYTEMWPEDILYVAPQSPSPQWPHFWLYDGPHLAYTDGDGPYNELVRFVTGQLDDADCGPIMMHGTSSGGGFAAKLYCRGEDFGGRLWSVMVDDPVPDAAVIGCSPSSSVQRVLFTHSSEIAREVALFVDNRCTASPTLPDPWYCEDDIAFDVDEYEAHIGQDTILAREMHVGGNDPAYNFWTINLSWWYEYDPVRFAALAGR